MSTNTNIVPVIFIKNDFLAFSNYFICTVVAFVILLCYFIVSIFYKCEFLFNFFLQPMFYSILILFNLYFLRN